MYNTNNISQVLTRTKSFLRRRECVDSSLAQGSFLMFCKDLSYIVTVTHFLCLIKQGEIRTLTFKTEKNKEPCLFWFSRIYDFSLHADFSSQRLADGIKKIINLITHLNSLNKQ